MRSGATFIGRSVSRAPRCTSPSPLSRNGGGAIGDRTILNIDGLNNAPLAEVAKATFIFLDRLQNLQPHMQAASTAVLFLLVCERHHTKPQDVFTAARNMLASDLAGENPHFNALRMYLKHERTA